ncbi:MAG: metallophosphoesterase [Desulfarculus sp.]|nr:metallophosphoesterase [Desulfarculus sp.]
MPKFLLYFFLVYGGIHAVLWLRFRPLLPAGRAYNLWLGLFFLAMILAPVASRLIERGHGPQWAAALFAWIGYCWMGLAGLGFGNSLLSWIIQGLAWLAGRLGWLVAPAGLGRALAWLALLAAVLTAGYGVIEARTLTLERLTLTSSKLPPDRPRLVIAQVSDVHLGLIHGQQSLARIVERIKAAQPDLVVSTGDLVDGNLFLEDGLYELWAGLKPPLGKYAITGNHELYAGLGQSLAFLERAGFTVLRNQAATVAGALRVAGVDDPVIPGPPPDEAAILRSGPPGLFTLLLKHRPTVEPTSLGLFDLQLSGHTHRGQVYPFNYLTGAIYPMQEGLHRLARGSALYTNRGTGTWGPPMRVAAPPEVPIIEIVRAP